MKSQPTSNHTRIGHISSVIILLLIFSVFGANQALAKKPVPERVTGAENLARWGDDADSTPGILEPNYRHCSLIRATEDRSSGAYDCMLNDVRNSDPRVFYDFAHFEKEVAHRNGEDWRCMTEGSQYYMEPDLEYSYTWDGDCTSDAGCDVTIVNRFTDISVLGGPVNRVRFDMDLDRLTLEGFGRVSNTTPNPFDESHLIAIDYMLVTFIGAKGKGKALSVCRLTPVDANYPVNFDIVALEAEE